ncbi:MAG: hypothetical protein J6B53_17795 [Clostridia bacterium]|nr:hypothetical protein [Clostridia bacterium]
MIELFNQEHAVQAYGNAREKKGIKIGENQLAQLIAKLFDLGKIEDLEKVSKDPEYREQLLKDYGLAKA